MMQRVKMKQRKNLMKRMMRMKGLVVYGSNLRERMEPSCGCLMHALKGGTSLKHWVPIIPATHIVKLIKYCSELTAEHSVHCFTNCLMVLFKY